MGDEPRKRSRFDQEEPVRRSKFDRRSRSPPHGDSEARATRSRSPVVKEGSGPKRDAAAAAAHVRTNLHLQPPMTYINFCPLVKVVMVNNCAYRATMSWVEIWRYEVTGVLVFM